MRRSGISRRRAHISFLRKRAALPAGRAHTQSAQIGRHVCGGHDVGRRLRQIPSQGCLSPRGATSTARENSQKFSTSARFQNPISTPLLPQNISTKSHIHSGNSQNISENSQNISGNSPKSLIYICFFTPKGIKDIKDIKIPKNARREAENFWELWTANLRRKTPV
jgi:hypothetical protein